jgi:hypothetical protein
VSAVELKSLATPGHDGQIDLIVDLLAVVRARDLPPQGILRWVRLVSALQWWNEHVSQSPRLLIVADKEAGHLIRRHDPDHLSDFKNAVREGFVLIAPNKADLPLLDRAEQTGAAILTRDQYDAHRLERWDVFVGNPLYGLSVRDGKVMLVQEEWRAVSPQSVSADLERHLLKTNIPLEKRDAILAYDYQCREPDCFISRVYDGAYPHIPLLVNGEACCENCTKPLHKLGPRPESVEIYFGLADALATVVAEATAPEIPVDLPVGSTWQIGLAAAPDMLDASRYVSGASGISTPHISLSIERDSVVVQDLGSETGTFVQRRSGREATELSAVGPLPPGRSHLRSRDFLYVGNVRIRRSGKRFPRGDVLNVHSDDRVS